MIGKLSIKAVIIFVIAAFILTGCTPGQMVDGNKNDRTPVEWEFHAPEEGSGIEIKEFRLDDYGAKGDGVTDNTQAMMNLLSDIKNVQSFKRVIFGKGTYYFKATSLNVLINLGRIENIEFTGQGPLDTEIIIGNPRAGFMNFHESNNIIVKNLSLDWNPLPFTQGTIVAKDDSKATFDVKIDAGFPDPTGEWYTKNPPGGTGARWGVIVDPATNELKAGAADAIWTKSNVDDLGGGIYRLYLESRHYVSQIKVGDKYAQNGRFINESAIGFILCKNTKVENVNIYSCPAIIINNLGTDKSVVRNVKIMKKPGSGRLITSNADAFHYANNRGGILVEDCFTEALLDDAVAINHRAFLVKEVVSSTEIVIENWINNFVGDPFLIYHPIDGSVVGQSTIESIQPFTTKGQWFARVKLTSPIEGIRATDNDKTTDHFYNLNSIGSNFIIRNNKFKQQRVRHLFIESQNGVIEDNILEGAGTVSMIIANEIAHPPYPLGIFPSNIVIRNNKIYNGGTSAKWFKDWSAILVKNMQNPTGNDLYETARARSATNFEIVGNEIYNSYFHSIFLGAVKTAKVNNNKIINDKDWAGHGKPVPVVFDNCEDIEFANNTIVDERIGVKAAVEIRANTEKGEKGVRITGLKATLPTGAREVNDLRK